MRQYTFKESLKLYYSTRSIKFFFPQKVYVSLFIEFQINCINMLLINNNMCIFLIKMSWNSFDFLTGMVYRKWITHSMLIRVSFSLIYHDYVRMDFFRFDFFRLTHNTQLVVNSVCMCVCTYIHNDAFSIRQKII